MEIRELANLEICGSGSHFEIPRFPDSNIAKFFVAEVIKLLQRLEVIVTLRSFHNRIPRG